MTDQEVIAALRGESLLNRVRREMVSAWGRIEQELAQSRLVAVDMRRYEFRAAQRLIEIVREECRRCEATLCEEPTTDDLAVVAEEIENDRDDKERRLVEETARAAIRHGEYPG